MHLAKAIKIIVTFRELKHNFLMLSITKNLFPTSEVNFKQINSSFCSLLEKIKKIFKSIIDSLTHVYNQYLTPLGFYLKNSLLNRGLFKKKRSSNDHLYLELSREAKEIKLSNNQERKKIKNFWISIKSNSRLFRIFLECKRENEHILLSLPERDQNPPIENPVVEEWRQAMLEACYLDSVRTRIKQFLEVSPRFCAAYIQEHQHSHSKTTTFTPYLASKTLMPKKNG
ncbi:hypothetical protein PHSC3_001648 [Chlamydiales bacterium STE3]|nr:hypothetical protein PHSC3_001648 [Chlamydiales bacterium STE3]